MSNANQLVQKHWNYCNILRDDGLSYGDYVEQLTRDKLNFDIFWLKDEALEESANLPDPDVIAADIVADLEAALEQFAAIADDLNGSKWPSIHSLELQALMDSVPRGEE